MKETVKYTKRMIETEPWKSLVVREVDPGQEFSTDEEIKGGFHVCCDRAVIEQLLAQSTCTTTPIRAGMRLVVTVCCRAIRMAWLTPT